MLMEKQSGPRNLSIIIIEVSVIEECSLSGVPLYTAMIVGAFW